MCPKNEELGWNAAINLEEKTSYNLCVKYTTLPDTYN
jgi:hypothetical protein